jgi:hypothetical protein
MPACGASEPFPEGECRLNDAPVQFPMTRAPKLAPHIFYPAGSGPRLAKTKFNRSHAKSSWAFRLIAMVKADFIRRLHPRQFQPALNFALMTQIKGFTRELTMPPSDCRITGRTQWLGFPKTG